MRPDGVLEQDVRITLKTDDGAFIYVRYAGMRHGPPEVMARLAQGETVDPSESDTVCEPTGDKVSAGSVCGNRRPRKLNALAT
jgi:hypothetical protein